jgi:HAD superfamily hydrolase (TIGR01662 family)
VSNPARSPRRLASRRQRPFTGRLKTLWLQEAFLSQILAGHKTIEVRVGYRNIQRLEPGDRLRLNDRHLATIRRIGRYANFEELLAHEDAATIAPGLPSDEVLAALQAIYPAEKEALGAVAIELALHRYDAVLFDMGYTLVGFEPAQEIIAQRALRRVGVERSVNEIRSAIRSVFDGYYRDAQTATFPATEAHDREVQQRFGQAILSQLGLETDESTMEAYTRAMDEEFSQPGVIRPYPEVVEVLEALRGQGYRLGIVSNWSWNLRDRVAQVGLEGHFEVIWASAYAGCNKPNPGIFHQALEQMRLPHDRALYVGDSYVHDVVGARLAGVDVALLDRNHTADERDCPVIHDLGDVLDLLDHQCVRARDPCSAAGASG